MVFSMDLYDDINFLLGGLRVCGTKKKCWNKFMRAHITFYQQKKYVCVYIYII